MLGVGTMLRGSRIVAESSLVRWSEGSARRRAASLDHETRAIHYCVRFRLFIYSPSLLSQ